MDKLLSKGRIVLKRRTDFKMAVKIKNAFSLEGAHCTIVRQAGDGRPASPGPAPQPDQPWRKDTGNSRLMVCPQCERQQPVSAECCFCGIVFGKIRPKTTGNNSAGDMSEQEPQTKNERPPIRTDMEAATDNRFKNLIATFKQTTRKVAVWQGSLHRWSRKPVNALIQLAILWFVSLAISMGQLLLGRMLWFIYRWSPTGTYYLSKFQERSGQIESALETDPLLLSFSITLSIVLVCLFAAVIARVSHFMRFFFEPLGFVGKLAIWCVPLAGLSAWVITREHSHLPFTLSFLLAFLPVCVLMNGCFRAVQVMLPEIGALTSALGTTVPKCRQWMWRRLRKFLPM